MTDTRQSNIEESIATEKERDELRRRINAALAILPRTGRGILLTERLRKILTGEDASSKPDPTTSKDLDEASAQPFDPKVHSDKRGTVIGGGR